MIVMILKYNYMSGKPAPYKGVSEVNFDTLLRIVPF